MKNQEEKILINYHQKEHKFLDDLSKKGFLFAKYLDQIQKYQEENLIYYNQNTYDCNDILGMVNELDSFNYKDLRVIGKGAFGVVFSGKNGFQRSAIKVINIQGEQGQKIKQKVINEFNIQQDLKDCKYVVRAQRMVQSEKYIFIILEECFMNLETLIKFKLTDGKGETVRMNEVTFVKIAYELINGINCLHKKSIAVKDIKPDNILVNYNFIFQIGDLGLGQSLVKHNSLKYLKEGNLLYMSPERRRLCLEIADLICSKQDFKSHKVKTYEAQKDFLIKSDLFSLGLILCYILIGNEQFLKNFMCYYFLHFYKDFNKFIDLVYQQMIHFQYGSQLIGIIKNLCEIEPQNRISAETALTQIESVYIQLGLNEIKPIFIKEQQEKLYHYFKDDIEIINTYHDKGILVSSEKIHKQYQKNVSQEIKTNNSRIFLKTLRLNYLKLNVLPDLKQFPFTSNQSGDITMDGCKQIGGQNKQINSYKVPPILQIDSNSQIKEVPIKKQNSSPSTDEAIISTTQNYHDQNQNQKLKKESSIENLGQTNNKSKFLKKINQLYQSRIPVYQFDRFEEIQIKKISSKVYKFLLLIVILISIFEIECELSQYVDIPKLNFFGIFVLRLSTTTIQTIFSIYLFKNLLLKNHAMNRFNLFLICFIFIGFFTGISIFNNINSLFSLRSNETIFRFYSIGAQALILSTSIWLLLLFFIRQQIKIYESNFGNKFYDYFAYSDILKEYNNIKQLSV